MGCNGKAGSLPIHRHYRQLSSLRTSPNEASLTDFRASSFEKSQVLGLEDNSWSRALVFYVTDLG